MKQMKAAVKEAKSVIQKTQGDMVQYYNQRRTPAPIFHPEDWVFLSQMATYWFVIAWFDNQSVQKSKVRQAAKDVVKSEVYPQTYSP